MIASFWLSFGFFDSRPTGKILARIIGDVNSLKDVLSDSVTQLIPDLITVVCVAVIMLIKNYRLAMAALLTLPILVVGMLVIETTAHKRWQIYRKKTSNLNAYVHEDLSGIRVIQSFAAERIFDIIDTEAGIRDCEGAEELPDIEGTVDFEHVSFAYDDEPERMILKDVNFHIRQGETIALVGPTGAGKTTIVNLLSRFYEATDGRVLIDGCDIRKVTLKSLRSQMGIMTQDNFLFSGTIKYNIKYGRLDATDEEMIEACKLAQADEFIRSFPDGYDTKIEQGGSNVSGGQKQRVAIARALITQPSLLLADEPTGALDSKTSEDILALFKELNAKGNTIIQISHDVKVAQAGKRIVYIKDGVLSNTESD